MVISCKPIKGYNSFSTLFKTGIKIKTENIFCSIKFNNNIVKEDSHLICYGVTISKRNAKKAIIRNRIKRLLRESIRIIIKEFKTEYLLLINSIVLTWQIAPKHPKNISLNDVLPAVEKILLKAIAIYKNKK